MPSINYHVSLSDSRRLAVNVCEWDVEIVLVERQDDRWVPQWQPVAMTDEQALALSETIAKALKSNSDR